ncbi:MAG: SDR family oxidoreductase [Candidatus Binatia bacterium]|nr:SDR family oxidoreductase [Candidatus Binatia bacterium]
MILQGKTIVVMGVGDGLGREVAEKAARDGANVVLAARTEAQLEAVGKAIDPSGDRVAWLPTDLADDNQVQALVELAVSRFGRLDGLAQVAALASLHGSFEESDLGDWERAYQVNVAGTVRTSRAALPHMRKAGGGSIVLVGSQAASLPTTAQIAYAASKGALRSAMYYMAKELGPDKIRVNTVVPTWMWGPPVQKFVAIQAEARGVDESVVVAEIASQMPLGEIPEDGDVAEAIVFLCSDRARMITGQWLQVNAGQSMV